jgi:hypothetical protein
MIIRICAIGLAVAISIAAPGGAAAARSDLLFIPNGVNDHDSDDMNLPNRRAGSHYSIVVANLVRRCTDLSSQFNQAIAGNPHTAAVQGAMPDYRQGVTLCNAGSTAQGVDTLEAALKEIGAIPRISY